MKIRWKHLTIFTLLFFAIVAFAIYLAFVYGFAEPYVRRAAIRAIEQRTGARVEIKSLRLHPWRLRAEIDGLTLHGLEGSGPPLVHVDHIAASARIVSLLQRKWALDELIVDRPQVTVRVDAEGHSNVPKPPPRPPGGPWQDTILKLQVGHFEIRGGNVDFANRRIPLSLVARDFNFGVRYAAATSSSSESYFGNFSFQQVQIAERRDRPFAFDLNGRFTLHRDSFELDQLALKLPHSEFELRAELPSFAKSDFNLRSRGKLSLEDIRSIFHAPTTPDGIADFSGQAHYSGGQWTGSGYYNAHDIGMPYQWFHARGLRTWGDFEIAQQKLVVPLLNVSAFDGSIKGRLEMNFKGLAFRTETKLRGANLAHVLAALNNRSFPVNTLHWDGLIDADCVNTWVKNFKHFETKGETRWSPPTQLSPGMIPTSASIDYDYSSDRRAVEIEKGGEISLPRTKLSFYGPLGGLDSGLELKFHTDELHDWQDFVNVLRGSDAKPVEVAGRVDWTGRILGPIAGPTFAGHIQASNARYDTFSWDAIAGDMEYSPDDFKLTNATVALGQASALLSVTLQLDRNWGFSPTDTWSLRVQLNHSPTAEVQQVLGFDYPIAGLLTGDFRGGGTRAAPFLDANFSLENIEAKGFHFDRLTGQLHLKHDDIRLADAELRLGSARVNGELAYQPQEGMTQFNLSGSGIALERLKAIQSTSIAIGGQLEFHLRGSGPILAPVAQGDLHFVNFRIGTENQGNFVSQISSDGHTAHLTINSETAAQSATTQAKLAGDFTVGLSDDEPISGKLSIQEFDLDPFIVAGLHLSHITSHSSTDGVFTISGALRKPDSIQVVADVTRITFAYELVRLANDQDIRLTYRRNEVRVDQAHLHGPDTDFRISGTARFDRDRPLRLAVSGLIDLRLLAGWLRDFEISGNSTVDVSIAGTISHPRITGRARVKDARASYSDFPVGLSNVNGDFVFDQSRLLFDHLTAQSGGGQLTLSGDVLYGEGDLRYELNVRTTLVRVRYPVGMSWLTEGNLQLAGSSSAALLSGRVQVQRLLFAQGVDIASFFASASETTSGPPSSSPFLRNLSFDVEGQTMPGAEIQWTGAHVGLDGDVRLRGTWDHPIILGNIHLVGGQMAFRGNTFDLDRGDINFSNPFRLDPVLNIEATTTISQYQVTINFSGPASRMQLSYRSDPPLPDSDIISLLALGSPGQEAGLRSSSTTSSQNYGATALLSEAISTGIGGRIEHLFGISQFRVDPFVAGTATESNAAARVTIQEQLARDLTITYSTNAATTNQYQLVQVQYNISRDLSVEFLRDINGTYGFDIKWVRRIK